MKKILAVVFALMSAAALAGPFQVTKGSEPRTEGPPAETIVMLTRHHQFSFVPPYGYTSSVKTNLSRIDFLSPGGNIGISIQVTTNFPGGMPEESELRARMSALYSGCQFVVASGVFFYHGAGRSVDVLRVLPNKSRLMTRQAFLPFDEGMVEVALTSDEASFSKQRRSFSALVSSFRIEDRENSSQALKVSQ